MDKNGDILVKVGSLDFPRFLNKFQCLEEVIVVLDLSNDSNHNDVEPSIEVCKKGLIKFFRQLQATDRQRTLPTVTVRKDCPESLAREVFELHGLDTLTREYPDIDIPYLLGAEADNFFSRNLELMEMIRFNP